MKSIVTSLLFAVGLLAAATVSWKPTTTAQAADPKLPAMCCEDPYPVCPPFCPKQPPAPGGDRRR